ncbi:MAG TPA: nucleotidyl transferase AbiEii/AbiGii toxin family protein, partial [Polyangiaceae bacterium]
MIAEPALALRDAAAELTRLRKRFAMVGGLAVSIRAEVRFTRDVDLAVDVQDDEETESMARELRARGYQVIALVEHEAAGRLATVRLRAPSQVTVDLLTASSGIERELVERATSVPIEDVGTLPVANAEDLLATKIL